MHPDLSLHSLEGERGLTQEIDKKQKIASEGLPVTTVTKSKKPQVYYSHFLYSPNKKGRHKLP